MTPYRPHDRRTMRPSAARAAAALIAAALALAACQGAGTAPTDGWTEAQLAQVLDLGELGRHLTPAPDGQHLLLDGRALPPEVLERLPHLTMGRTTNLLRFGDDAIMAMSPEAQTFVLRAAPAELRARMATYGLGVPDLRVAWGESGTLDLAGLRGVAAALDAAAHGAGARGLATGAGPGARLLADLGVAP